MMLAHVFFGVVQTEPTGSRPHGKSSSREGESRRVS